MGAKGIEGLRRIVWLLRERYPEQNNLFQLKQIRLAIMEEVGVDERTIKNQLAKLQEMGMLKRINRWWFKDQGIEY